MKKLAKIILLLVVLVLSLVFATACETLENHEHEPIGGWLSDGTNHYRACAFEGCTEKLASTACVGGNATCQARATCLVCGNQYGELGEHSFVLCFATEEFLVTPATHTDKAYYYKSCACGQKGTETFQAGEVVAHVFKEVINKDYLVSEANCTTPAIYNVSCECGVAGSETFTYGKELDHSYTTYTYNNDATCTTNGTETAKCDRCNVTDTREAYNSALGHDVINHDAQAPTCTAIGWDAYETCSRCDYTTYNEAIAIGHTWDEWQVTTEPTCTEKGIETRICINDDSHKETRNVDPTGHTGSWIVDKEATCTTDGSEYQICSICGVSTKKTIPTIEHQYQEATCDAPMKCVLCGKTYGTHKGHSFSGNYCINCGENLYNIFDYEYYSGDYFIGNRNYGYGTACITSCTKTYYKYNNSLTMVVKTKATISNSGSFGVVISYKVCLYSDGVLFASENCTVSGSKGTTAYNSVTFYNVTPGVYTIKIINNG